MRINTVDSAGLGCRNDASCESHTKLGLELELERAASAAVGPDFSFQAAVRVLSHSFL